MSARLVNVDSSRRKRVLILSDVANEADDPFAIAHGPLSPSLEIEGIVATHYVRPGSTDQSYKAAFELARIIGIDGSIPVVRGAEAPLDAGVPHTLSQGAKLLVERARVADDRILYVFVFGSITEVAEALVADPSITTKIRVVFVGGAPYLAGGREANLTHDLEAARRVFASDVELWQLTSGAYHEMVVPIAWLLRKVEPLGELGHHLYQHVIDFDQAKLRSSGSCPSVGA